MSGFLLVEPGSYLLINGSGDKLLLQGETPPAPESTFAGAGLLPNIRRMVAERERLWQIQHEKQRRESQTALVSITVRASVFVAASVESSVEAIPAQLSCRSFCRSASVEAVAQLSIAASLSTFAGGRVCARRDDDELAFLLRLL